MIKEEKGEKKITYKMEHYYCDLCGKEFVRKPFNKWHTNDGGNTITIVDDEESEILCDFFYTAEKFTEEQQKYICTKDWKKLLKVV